MASGSAGRLFSLDEVVAELDSMAIPGPVIDDEVWSDDDFDGYVGEPDGQVVERERVMMNSNKGKQRTVKDWSLEVNVK